MLTLFHLKIELLEFFMEILFLNFKYDYIYSAQICFSKINVLPWISNLTNIPQGLYLMTF